MRFRMCVSLWHAETTLTTIARLNRLIHIGFHNLKKKKMAFRYTVFLKKIPFVRIIEPFAKHNLRFTILKFFKVWYR